jgi:hypothetical protein
MQKKLITAMVAIVLFSGAWLLNAQEVLEKPKAQRQQQKQVQQRRKRFAGKERTIQQADKRKAQPARQRAGAQAGPKARGRRSQGDRSPGREINRAQMFQRWFTGLKKAYREKDMDKMGQLLRTMEQRQQQMRERWQANMQHNIQPRQRAMYRRRDAGRKHVWAKSNYRQRQRLGSYSKSRIYDRNFRESDRNHRSRPRLGRDRQRSGWRRYYRL